VDESAQRLAPRDQLVDPAGQVLFDIDECSGERVGIGVEHGGDLGQRYACAGQCSDLDQSQQVGRFVASVAGGVAAGFGDQAVLVVVPDGFHRDTGEGRGLTDGDPVCHGVS
jgi:hypothetical protein